MATATAPTNNVRCVKLRKLRYGSIRISHEETTLRRAERGPKGAPVRYRVRIIVSAPTVAEALTFAMESYNSPLTRISPYNNGTVLVEWQY